MRKEQPSQQLIEDLLAAEPDPGFEQKLKWLRHKSRAAIQGSLKKHEVDAILAPGDSRLCAIAAVAGYACGSLPLGYARFNGRAFGMHILAGENGEKTILQIMSAWESMFPEGRKAPPMMLDYKD